MKLVIDTQFCENYGSHAWDGKGECPQRWKFKGGETYVVLNITPAQQARIERDGIPTLAGLIEYSSDYAKEYIISYRVVEDAAQAGEEWETPYELAYVDEKWIARHTIENGEYGYMHRDVARKTEQYTMLPKGERTVYTASYEMRDGRIMNEDALWATAWGGGVSH